MIRGALPDCSTPVTRKDSAARIGAVSHNGRRVERFSEVTLRVEQETRDSALAETITVL